MSFDIQLCEYARMVKVVPFYRKMNRDPDHITRKEQKLWHKSFFLMLKFLFSNICLLSFNFI